MQSIYNQYMYSTMKEKDIYTEQLKHSKIVTLKELLSHLNQKKNAGEKIVFTNGCYDILHPGHVDLLARAKTYGDILIVGMNSDASVRRLDKAADRPLNPFSVRSFVLAHLESVNFIIRFDEDTPLRLIEAICPNILIKGGDWPIENIVGAAYVERNNGIVLSLPLVEGHSTTNLLQKIRSTKR